MDGSCDGMVGCLLFVIASEAKQSRATTGLLDCFVASLLAMTVAGQYGKTGERGIAMRRGPAPRRQAMKLFAVVALALTMFTTQASAWCYVSKDGGRNCGFATKKQCEAARRGNSTDVCTRY